MLFLAPILGLMPNATLAAVVVVHSVGLIKPSEFRAIRSVRTMEFRWAMVAGIGVLLLGTLKGIVVSNIVSMIGLASQSAYPRVYVIGRKRGEDVLRPLSPEHSDDETFEGLLILRPEGRLFFVSAQAAGQPIQSLVAKYQPRVLVLDMSRVSDIEYSALQMVSEGDRRMTESGVEVWSAALNPGVLATVRKHGPRRAAWSRAHAVQRARGDRALPGAAGDRRKRGRERIERQADVAIATPTAHAVYWDELSPKNPERKMAQFLRSVTGVAGRAAHSQDDAIEKLGDEAAPARRGRPNRRVGPEPQT